MHGLREFHEFHVVALDVFCELPNRTFEIAFRMRDDGGDRHESRHFGRAPASLALFDDVAAFAVGIYNDGCLLSEFFQALREFVEFFKNTARLLDAVDRINR